MNPAKRNASVFVTTELYHVRVFVVDYILVFSFRDKLQCYYNVDYIVIYFFCFKMTVECFGNEILYYL